MCVHDMPEAVCVACLREKLKAAELQLGQIREECAKIADTEPEPEGPMPEENVEAALRLSLEENVRATVRATRSSIARRIRAMAIGNCWRCPPRRQMR